MMKFFKLFFLSSAAVICAASLTFAQENGGSNASPLSDSAQEAVAPLLPASAPDSKKMKDLAKKNNAIAEEYIKLQKQISQIIGDYWEKKISKEEARRKLYPLIKQRMPGQSTTDIAAQIQSLKEQINYLEKVKENPDHLIDETISQMLNISGPEKGQNRP